MGSFPFLDAPANRAESLGRKSSVLPAYLIGLVAVVGHLCRIQLKIREKTDKISERTICL